MKWIIVILIVILILCITRLLRMKQDIQSINNSLKYIKEIDTNQQLTTTTFYKDICNLSISMNEILEKQKQISITSENSNREFRQAITNISHDIRTPLTSAKGYIQMILSNKTDENKKVEYLHIVESRLNALSKLMNDLLEYSMLIEGKVAMNFEKINVNNALRDIISYFYDSFIEKDFEVNLNIPDTVLYFMGDTTSFERILMNTIQNSLHHGTGVFGVSLDQEEKTILFRNKIANIREVEVDQLLNRFYTADKFRKDKSTGLGLAIVKELITNMGGSIDVYIVEDFLVIKIGLT